MRARAADSSPGATSAAWRLTTIRPVDVATYIEGRQQTHSAPDVKQQLAAVRMLFDWLITGQVVPVIRPQPCADRNMS